MYPITADESSKTNSESNLIVDLEAEIISLKVKICELEEAETKTLRRYIAEHYEIVQENKIRQQEADTKIEALEEAVEHQKTELRHLQQHLTQSISRELALSKSLMAVQAEARSLAIRIAQEELGSKLDL